MLITNIGIELLIQQCVFHNISSHLAIFCLACGRAAMRCLFAAPSLLRTYCAVLIQDGTRLRTVPVHERRTIPTLTWLPFTGVPARCVVVRVRCPGSLGSCSPVRSPGVLRGVLGHLAPVHQCARSMCCAVGCVCGVSLRSAHASIWTAAIRSPQGLGALRAHTRPSGRRLFCS